ncbi:MAG TPA: UvrB/UvrC motif-containing protein, partial [Candidatus Woesebacteria bacterium]|nr:UvrB/UvrC motif-containing protein [Candidatus Woesebacteria bacterium]
EKLLKREKDQTQFLSPNSSSVIQLSSSKQIDLSKIDPEALTPQAKNQLTTQLTKKMQQAAKEMNFELAVILRDAIKKLV